MDPILGGSLALGGLGAVGGIVGNLMGADANRAQRDWMHDEARSARGWQQAMASTSYVRATQDMKNAGLNPMLAIHQGGSATPSGASPGAPGMAPIHNPVAAAASSALEYARLKKDLNATDSAIQLQEAQKHAARADAMLKSNNSRTAAANAQAAEAELPAIRARALVEEKKAKIDEQLVTPDALLQRLGRVGGIINDALGALRPKIQIGGQGGRDRAYERGYERGTRAGTVVGEQ